MRKPILNIELIKTFAQAFMIWLVIMGWWPMTDVQQTVTLGMIMAGINLLGSYFETSQTTPLAAPKDEDGVPLVRSTSATVAPGQPTHAAVRSMKR
jgi:hypothetical protein